MRKMFRLTRLIFSRVKNVYAATQNSSDNGVQYDTFYTQRRAKAIARTLCFRRKSEFYRNGWADPAGFWCGGFSRTTSELLKLLVKWGC